MLSSSLLIVLVVLGAAAASYDAARHALREGHQNLETAYEIDSVVPTADAMSRLLLNHRTLAAELAWIAALIDYGEALRNKVTPSVNAYYHTDVIATLDPYFRRVYFWFDAVSMGTNVIVGPEDIDRANAVLDRGAKVFPTDRAFPNGAAMNFIGYSKNASKERRLDELERGISYLERSSLLPGADAMSPFVLRSFYDEKRRLLGQEVSREEQARELDFYREVYLTTTDPEVKRRLHDMLQDRGVDEKSLQGSYRKLESQYEADRIRDGRTYLPEGLWLELQTQ